MPPTLAQVEDALHALHIGVPGASLRKEERQKAVEVTALLAELERVGGDPLLVDAAAGKGNVGLLAAHLLGLRRVVVIERDPRHAARLVEAAARVRVEVDVRIGDVGDPATWPEHPDAVVALHACGGASDAVIDAAIACRTRWLLLVPCCYGRSIPGWQGALDRADALGVPRHPRVRNQVAKGLVDAERTLRLEAAGWECTVLELVPPTITPHNLLWRARRLLEPGRMAAARRDLESW